MSNTESAEAGEILSREGLLEGLAALPDRDYDEDQQFQCMGLVLETINRIYTDNPDPTIHERYWLAAAAMSIGDKRFGNARTATVRALEALPVQLLTLELQELYLSGLHWEKMKDVLFDHIARARGIEPDDAGAATGGETEPAEGGPTAA